MNYSHRGNMGDFDPALCEFNKIRVKASALMYTKMILSNNKKYKLLQNMSDEQLNDIITGITKIQENL